MNRSELYEIRRELGLTQDGLAGEVGVRSGRTVRRWELGERKVPETVARLLLKMVYASRKRLHFGKL